VPTELRPDTLIAQRRHVRTLPLPDGGLTLYAADESTAYVMNPSAAVVWTMLASGTTRAAIVEELVDRVGDQPDLPGDVEHILEDMHRAGLLSIAVADDVG